MKTILYQPLFINPQAYFVFPQLYHIEKGDSYIEPANITGQLIINDLTKSLTSTPILNVVQDTNQVDFGLFKGKHIRISQYTNIGAVALGEWYIPGTPTPPEPEQPDWFKESIVAWYSPYCKQRMTNFDVIESYADDFTKWRIESTGVTSTQKKIVIAAGTELKYNVAYKGFGNSIAEFDIKYTGSAVIRYCYNKEDGTTGIITINRSGIYHLPASIKAQKNFGFYCNPQTVTEEATIEQLPTSILKDFSGNGNHAYLYGGKGKLNSGMGVYKEDFTTWNYVPERGDVTRSYNTIHITKVTNTVTANIISKTNEFGNSITLKIVGATYDNPLMVGTYSKPNGFTAISKDGVYSFEIDEQYWGFRFNKDGDVNVTITQIPDYPDQLCYDGKMYAVCYGFPILTDYTVMAERTWFESDPYCAFISNRDDDIPKNNRGAFVFEQLNGGVQGTSSFGSIPSINFVSEKISWQTKESYNGKSIRFGSNISSNPVIVVGAGVYYTNSDGVASYANLCHGNILLFNRSLTEYEISWVKNNMMCSKQQEPDIDL